jgi:alpha-tubulin suppressor-like RCC1 family protein
MRTMIFGRVAAPLASLLVVTLGSCLGDLSDPSITGPELKTLDPALSSVADASRSGPVSVDGLQAASGTPYFVVPGGMAEGARAYSDRDFSYQGVPAAVRGQTYIQTADDDREIRRNPPFLSFDIDREAIVYVAFNSRNHFPGWLKDDFVNTGQTLTVDTGGQRSTYTLWARTFPAGRVHLGSNVPGHNGAHMYTVIVANTTRERGPFTSVTAGFYHTCGLSAFGAAFCWGDSDYGQLGTGTNNGSNFPVAVVGDLTFRSLSAGGHHTCGVTTEEEAYCWGRNNNGQLGDGTTTRRTRPVPVAGNLRFAWIGAGGFYSCGLTTGGEAYCWGKNDKGQLGKGSSGGTITPVPVADGHFFDVLTVGYEHACGVTTTGQAYCWGKNGSGQLGDGSRSNRRSPVAVLGDLTFGTVSATGVGTGAMGHGQNHTCGLTPDGVAYCWGDNWHNNLGIDHTRDIQTTPQPVRGVPLLRDIATGGDHSCGVTAAGEMWCWGDNLRGQLGNGPRGDFNPSIRVAGGHSFDAIALGWDHTCGVTPDGDAFCWGWNSRGQLGDGTRTTRPSPALVQFR